MKKKSALLGIIGVLILSVLSGASLQEGEDLFQKAVRLERSDGKLQEAISLYQQILQKFPDDRTLAAKAQLHIGYCFEKLGQKEAQKAYESVIEQYGDQTEQVAAARARLSGLTLKTKPGPSQATIYSWSDEDFYLEDHTLSPDGRKLAGIHIFREKGQNVVYKDIARGKYEFVTNYDGENEESGWAYDPVWSPDSKQIAFSFGDWKGKEEEEIRISTMKGESQTVFRCQSKEDEVFPVEWFPEGKSLLVVHQTADKVIRLGTIPLAEEKFEVLYEIYPEEDSSRKLKPDNVLQSDLSPDGKKVVFREIKEGSQNLYVLDVASKKVEVFLDSPNNKEQPCWSPDGKHVAFLSDRSVMKSIWVVSVGKDGAAEGQPYLFKQGPFSKLKSWTSHGMCYSSWIQMVDVFIMPVDPQSGAPAGKPVQLDFQPTGRNSLPVWSPDGTHLAFMSNISGGLNDFYIVVFSLDGREARKFKAPSTRVGGTSPPSMTDLRWLPDGSGISYSARENVDDSSASENAEIRKLYILKLDNGEWQSHQLKLENASSSTAWRKDGQGFYYARNSWEPVSLKTGIIEHDLNTGEECYIYSSKIQVRQGFPSMRLSRDYTKIATHLFREKKLCVIDINSGETIHQFNFFGFPSPPAWSPDGTHLMISMWRQNQKLHVFSLSDGSKKSYDVDLEFAPNNGIAHLDWSPDGSKIAFSGTYTKFETFIFRNSAPQKTSKTTK